MGAMRRLLVAAWYTVAALRAADAVLTPGKVWQGSFGDSPTRSFRVKVGAGEYVEFIAWQKLADLELRLFSPGGQRVFAIDSPNGFFGTEQFCWIAEQAGEYRLEVAVLARQRKPRVGITVSRPHPPSATDRYRFEAYQALAQARQARAEQTPESSTRSLELFARAAELFTKSRTPRGAAIAWHGISTVEGRRGKRREAIEWARKAAVSFHEAGEPSGELRVQADEGMQHAALGDHAAALSIYQKAAATARGLRDRHQEAALSNAIAASYLATGRYGEAGHRFQQAIQVFHALPDPLNEARCWASLGVVHRSRSDHAGAVAAYQRAAMLFAQVGNKTELPALYFNMGTAAALLGDQATAIQRFERALALAIEHRNRPVESHILQGIGSAYLALQQAEKAEGYFASALAKARELKLAQPERSALFGVGRAHEAAGRWAEAEAAYREVTARALQSRASEDEGGVREHLGLLLAKRNKLDDARAEIHRSLEIRTKIGNKKGIALSRCALAQVELAGDPRASRANAALCLAQSLAIGFVPGQARAATLLMQAHRALGQPNAAVYFGKQAVNRYQEVRANARQLGDDIQQRYAESRAGTYRELAALLLAQGRLPEARQVLSLLKEQEYFELLRGEPRSTGVAGRIGLTDAEHQATERVTALSPRRDALLGKTKRTPQEEKELQTLDRQLTVAQGEFVAALDRLADDLAAKPQMVRVEQIRESQGLMDDLRELPAHAAAIYTLAAPEALHLVLVTGGVQRAYERRISSFELAQRVLEFRADLEDPRRDPKPRARGLGDLLLPAELKADLAAAQVRVLMWSLDGPLRYLPVAALLDGERYLVERYPLAVFTPASQARLKDPPKPAWRVAALGVSQAQGDLPALPQVPVELKSIVREEGAQAGVLPGVLFLDQAFTRDALLSTRQRFPVLHIASHFQFQPGSSADSFLLLGDGSHFSLQDLRAQTNLFTRVDLLTLSACNTGLGDGRGDGREVESFAVLAQRQGAKAVLASLWSVSDTSTAELMKGFYQLRETERISKAEAMQRAQLALLRGEKEAWRHPFFWAPFFVVGNWQ